MIYILCARVSINRIDKHVLQPRREKGGSERGRKGWVDRHRRRRDDHDKDGDDDREEHDAGDDGEGW